MTTGRFTKRLVLLGGGHAHVFVLESLAREPVPGLAVTLVTKERKAPYSGMLPGFVAGHYALDECLIDLDRLCRKAGVDLTEGAACGLDREKRAVELTTQESIPYDVLSIDVGITPDVGDIAGAAEHALLVKPVSEFAPKWQALAERAQTGDAPRHIVVIGGGAAGVELTLAARFHLSGPGPRGGRGPVSYTLVAGDAVLASHPPRARQLARAALARSDVRIIENDPAVAMAAGRLRLRSGETIACDAAIVSTKAKAPAWLAATGLACDDGGYLALRPTLQSVTDEHVFAAGDCATVLEHRRPKAGVFAVRQGPVLARNLRRFLVGEPVEPFVPQERFLTLISLGEKSAIASRGSWAVAGHWAWLWKDWIDRRFMARFNDA